MRIVECLVALGVSASILGACEDSKPRTTVETRDMKELVIPVEGMACGSCAERVENALTAIEGVGPTTVSVDEKTVVTHYDPRRVSPDTLVAAINKLGFTAGAPTEAMR